MEHPVPQNVTSFEFHLVGDMTLKQFVYLAAGLGLAYLIFVLLFPTLPYLALPVIIISSLSGTALAFLPILDRPFDHWVLAFFKSIYSPTQGLFKTPDGKIKKIAPDDPLVLNRLKSYLSTIGAAPEQIKSAPSSQPAQNQLTRITPSFPLSPSPDKDKIVELTGEKEYLKAKLNEAEKQIILLKQTLLSHPAPIQSRPAQAQPMPILQPIIPRLPKAVIVESTKAPPTQILLTSFPNVINGIVSDSAGNYLEGAIVIIHNKEGLPVRALKTNKLGQFSGSTPLPSGVYTVTLEKEGWEFDALQINLTGDVLSPLNIQAKKT